MPLRAQRGNLLAILSDMQGRCAWATRLPRRPQGSAPEGSSQ